MKKALLAALLTLFFTPVHAEVPVEERGVSRSDASVQQPVVTQRTNSNTIAVSTVPPEPVAQDTFGTLQLLQQEVMTLRGLVEELSNEVRLLKQRQVDDYLDLDRRISSGVPTGESGADLPTATATPPSSTSTLTTSPAPAPQPAADEVAQYSAAYNLLKQGDVQAAKDALQLHTQNFPNGDYTPNAYYWLGEVYLLENDLQRAIQSFAMVVERYPAHRKADDARFKLGKSYHLAGDNEQALTYLKQSSEGVGSSANLAKQYLSENF